MKDKNGIKHKQRLKYIFFSYIVHDKDKIKIYEVYFFL